MLELTLEGRRVGDSARVWLHKDPTGHLVGNGTVFGVRLSGCWRDEVWARAAV